MSCRYYYYVTTTNSNNSNNNNNGNTQQHFHRLALHLLESFHLIFSY